jgi:2-amino-4-hydroxy-6-hydroxymethyldihydropteridine diphosphokinase
MEPQRTEIFLALGTNLGDRLLNLETAKAELSAKISITQTSSVYETPPWGYLPQPTFLNQVLSATTTLNPFELLQFVKEIEQKMGRAITFRNGPRLIDIDILVFAGQTIDTPDLVIPHPRILERGFVLVPLAEIAPDLVIPGTQSSIKEHLQKIDQDGIHKIQALV